MLATQGLDARDGEGAEEGEAIEGEREQALAVEAVGCAAPVPQRARADVVRSVRSGGETGTGGAGSCEGLEGCACACGRDSCKGCGRGED